MRFWLVGFSFLLLFTIGCSKKKKDDPLPLVLPTSPISVEVTTPSSPQTGEITIDYNLIDDRGSPVNADIKVYYSANGGWFTEATVGTGGDGTTNLSTAATPGAAHTYVWDSVADLATGVYSVIVKIVPYETGTTELGYEGQTGVFQVVIAEPVVTPQLKVFDPKLPGASSMDIQYRVDPGGVSFTVTVKVVTDPGAAEVRRLVDAQSRPGGTNWTIAWDGKDDGGKFVDTGDYKVVAEGVYQTLPAWTGEAAVHIVRLGVAGIQFLDNGVYGEEHQMMFHIRRPGVRNYTIPENWPEWAMGPDSGDLADLDTDDGLPRPLPDLWTELNSPPQDSTDTANDQVEDDNYNLPVCYERASLPRFILTLGSSAVSNSTPNTAIGCDYPVSGLPIRVVAAGANPETAGTNEDVSPGGTVSFIAGAWLPDAVQKNQLNYTFTFEYQDGGVWHQIPGQIDTLHNVYTIFDKPMLTDSATPVAPYLPWVRVVDIVCGWINGPATEHGVCAEVTNSVNAALGVQYDIWEGGWSYTSGVSLGSPLTMLMFDFLADLDTSNLDYINCADCANLVSTFANTVGVDHKYVIIGESSSIPLNYMIAIGWTDWIIAFEGSFRYHSVPSKDEGVTISDACCTLDGDGNPSSAPHTPVLPVNMPYDVYKAMLSWSPSSYGIYSIFRCYQQ